MLGHLVSREGIRVDPFKVEKLCEKELLVDLMSLRSFCSAASYYRRAVRGFTEITYPLYKLLRKDQPFDWKEEHSVAVARMKEALQDCVQLRPPDWNKEFWVSTVVSPASVEAHLYQWNEEGKEWCPIYFTSRLLKDYETQYSAIERQVLVLVFAARKFRHYLAGRAFHFLGRVAAVRSLMAIPILEGRIGKWMVELTCFEFDVQVKPKSLMKLEQKMLLESNVAWEASQCEDEKYKEVLKLEIEAGRLARPGVRRAKQRNPPEHGSQSMNGECVFVSVEASLNRADPEGFWKLWFDGASSRQRKLAGAGAIILDAQGQIGAQGQQRLEVSTCNEAKYQAIMLGMRKALDMGVSRIKIFGDSKLVVQQMRGVLDAKLQT